MAAPLFTQWDPIVGPDDVGLHHRRSHLSFPFVPLLSTHIPLPHGNSFANQLDISLSHPIFASANNQTCQSYKNHHRHTSKPRQQPQALPKPVMRQELLPDATVWTPVLLSYGHYRKAGYAPSTDKPSIPFTSTPRPTRRDRHGTIPTMTRSISTPFPRQTGNAFAPLDPTHKHILRFPEVADT